MPNILKRKAESKMMVVMTFEVDTELFQQASRILAQQGLTLGDAIELLFKETARTGKIPFTYTQEELEYAQRHPCVRLVEEHLEDDTP